MTRERAILALLATCLIWGASFPLAKLALAGITPLNFSTLRFLLALLCVLPLLRGANQAEWRAGSLLGLLLGVAFAIQTVGLNGTTASRSGFLTALYIPFTPVVVFVVHRRRPSPRAAAGLAVATLGMYLLTGAGTAAGGINRGDLLVILAAFLFACHMVAVGHFAGRLPLRRLLGLQIAAAALVSAPLPLLFETPRITWSALVIGVILFEVLFATLIALYLQLEAQRVLTPTYTALVYAIEPVIAALASYLLLGDRLSLLQWLGGGLILLGTLLPEVEEQPTTATPADAVHP